MLREELCAGESNDPAACGTAAFLVWVWIDADGLSMRLNEGQGASTVYADFDVGRWGERLVDPPQHLIEVVTGECTGCRPIMSGHLSEIIRRRRHADHHRHGSQRAPVRGERCDHGVLVILSGGLSDIIAPVDCARVEPGPLEHIVLDGPAIAAIAR